MHDTSIKILNFFILFLEFWATIGFILTLVFFLFDKKERIKRRIRFIIIGQFIFCFFLIFPMGYLLSICFEKEFKKFLSEPELHIQIDKHILSTNETAIVIKELKKIKQYSAHNSSPEYGFNFKIYSKTDNVELFITQDSEIKNEFWVFCNNFRTTGNNEVGRITSDRLKLELFR